MKIMLVMKYNADKSLSLMMISGGKDSIVLILVFLLFNKRNKFLITHTNHFAQLDSFISVYHSFQVFSQTQNPGTINLLPSFKNLNLFNNENEFREGRYKQTARISEFYHGETLITAHSQSDKVETILANLIRGTDIFSLPFLLIKKTVFRGEFHSLLSLTNFQIYRGQTITNSFLFFPKKKITVVQKYSVKRKKSFYLKQNSIFVKKIDRPILFNSSPELKKVCKLTRAPLIADRTNKFISITRNRIRHHLVKYIGKNFNPKFERQMLRMFESINEQFGILNQYLDVSKKVIKPSDTVLIFDRELIALFPNSVQNYILLKLIKKNKTIKTFFFEQLLENPSFSSYILIDENMICYMSPQSIHLENYFWVTWDSNPELIG
jgi:tRNA(Ile)-lysidine synthase TilS/MesJ